MARDTIYQDDIACIHHVGFGDFSRRAAPGLIRLIHQAGIRRGVLVDLGCGSGLWASAAGRAGFSVIGVDQSAAMIRLAKRVAPAAKFNRVSLYDFKLPPCDAVTAIGEGLNYIEPGTSRGMSLKRLFTRVNQALRPGGVFIFDIVASEGRPLESRNWHAGHDWAVLTEVEERRKENRLIRRIVTFRKIGSNWRRGEETHRLRLFECREVERALQGAGFSVRQTRRYGAMALLPRRRAFIARKAG
jgi:SAM-dependent methyltransferase